MGARSLHAVGGAVAARVGGARQAPAAIDKHFFIEHDERRLSQRGDEEAEFKTAKAGID